MCLQKPNGKAFFWGMRLTHVLMKYLQEQNLYATKLAHDLKTFIAETESSPNTKLLAENLYAIASTLESHSRELNGRSHHLFDELIHTGSKLCNYFICNLGSDLFSSVNQQLLSFSNQLLVIVQDNSSKNIKDKYMSCKLELENKYKLQCQPVFVCENYNFNQYNKLSEADWLEVLGEKPILLEKENNILERLKYDSEKLANHSNLYIELESYLAKKGLKTKKHQKGKSILKFLTMNS